MMSKSVITRLVRVCDYCSSCNVGTEKGEARAPENYGTFVFDWEDRSAFFFWILFLVCTLPLSCTLRVCEWNVGYIAICVRHSWASPVGKWQKCWRILSTLAAVNYEMAHKASVLLLLGGMVVCNKRFSFSLRTLGLMIVQSLGLYCKRMLLACVV